MRWDNRDAQADRQQHQQQPDQERTQFRPNPVTRHKELQWRLMHL